MTPQQKTIRDQVRQILSQKHLWNYVFENRDRLDQVAVTIVYARCCTAGEFKGHLADVPDEFLELLDDPIIRSSSVKSKALDIRLRRRARNDKDLARRALDSE